jgi:hypothetical protein
MMQGFVSKKAYNLGKIIWDEKAIKWHKIQDRGQCYKTFSVRDLRIFILSWSVSQTRPEKLTNDQHSSLLRKSVIYGQKSFITLAPRQHLQ